jgi:sporulation protein YlmC with PRC-barrel domain
MVRISSSLFPPCAKTLPKYSRSTAIEPSIRVNVFQNEDAAALCPISRFDSGQSTAVRADKLYSIELFRILPRASGTNAGRERLPEKPDMVGFACLACQIRFSYESSGRHLRRLRRKCMLKHIIAAAAISVLATPAYAAQDTAKVQTAIPQNAATVTDWYKQDVYDPNNNKIGQVKDVLVDQSGKVDTLIIGVGGFLGAGEKDVAVPFEEVKATKKDNKVHLVMNATKDSLNNAPGFKYDSNTTTWIPDTKK